MVHWGSPIKVDGRRPDWLRDDDLIRPHYWTDGSGWYDREGVKTEHVFWKHCNMVRLSVDHPYYVATSKGFTYWPGGNAAPEDWDGRSVLRACGVVNTIANCTAWGLPRELGGTVIGYRKRTADVCCNRTVQVGDRCAGCPHDDEISNHMVAAPASYRGEIGTESALPSAARRLNGWRRLIAPTRWSIA